MAPKDPLEKLRAHIDEIDDGLLDLLVRRARCAEDVARAKREAAPDAPRYRPEREAGLLRRIVERNRVLRSPLSD